MSICKTIEMAEGLWITNARVFRTLFMRDTEELIIQLALRKHDGRFETMCVNVPGKKLADVCARLLDKGKVVHLGVNKKFDVKEIVFGEDLGMQSTYKKLYYDEDSEQWDKNTPVYPDWLLEIKKVQMGLDYDPTLKYYGSAEIVDNKEEARCNLTGEVYVKPPEMVVVDGDIIINYDAKPGDNLDTYV